MLNVVVLCVSFSSVSCWMSLWWVPLCRVSLCQVSLCWMSLCRLSDGQILTLVVSKWHIILTPKKLESFSKYEFFSSIEKRNIFLELKHVSVWHDDIQHNDTQLNDTHHTDPQLNDTQHNGTGYCYAEYHLCSLSFMLSVKLFLLLCSLSLCWMSLCWVSWRHLSVGTGTAQGPNYKSFYGGN